MKRSGTSEPIAPSRHTVGVSVGAGRAVQGEPELVRGERAARVAASSMAKVSVQMVLLPSRLAVDGGARWMSSSPAAQRPITYQGVAVPSE